MVEPNGPSTALDQMIKKFFTHGMWPWMWFGGEFDPIHEGTMAHEYTSDEAREEITRRYNEHYNKPITPWVNPDKFDPLNPPEGWAFDPYYFIWIRK